MQSKRLKPALIALFCVFASVGAPRADNGYRELLGQALEADPSIKRSQVQLELVRADISILDSRSYPRINGNLTTTQMWQRQDDKGVSPVSDTVRNYSYGVSGSVSVWDVRNTSSIESIAFDVRSAEAQITSTRYELISRFTLAYFQLLNAAQDFQIAKEEAQRVKAIVDQANAFLRAGTGDIISVHEAKARLDAVNADLYRYENNLMLARQRMGLLVGRDVESVEDFGIKSVSGPSPDDLSWWLEALEKNDPAMKAAKERLDKAVFDTEAAYTDYYPYFQVFGGASVSHGSPFYPDVETRQWNLGVGITVPIYSGGEVASRISKNVTTQSERKYYVQELRRQRVEYLKQLFYDLRYGVALIESLKQKKESVDLQLTGVRKGREIGTRTAIDLLNAEEAFSLAERDLKKAIYDNIIRMVQLKCLVGVVDENAIIPGVVK